MDADALRRLQEPIKALYRDDPSSARVTLEARGDLSGADLTCRVQTGRALVEAGLHPAAGGDGSWACSGEMLLEALAACAGVTVRAVAVALGIDVRGGTVTFPVAGVAKQVQPVDGEALRLQVLGKSIADARTLLAPFGDVDIRVWPDMITTIPTIDPRVTLVVLDPVDDTSVGEPVPPSPEPTDPPTPTPDGGSPSEPVPSG